MSHKLFRMFLILNFILSLSFTQWTPALAASPANDNFAAAELIPSLNFNVAADISEAGTETDEPQSCGPAFRTVWYTFTPTEDMVLRADINGSTVDGFLEVYRADGPGFAGLFQWACTGTGSAPAVFPIQAGNVYYFQLGARLDQAGTLQINLEQVPRPDNDNFAQAAVITALPFAAVIDNGAATLEQDEPQQCAGTYQTIWYSFQPAETMLVMASIEGSTLSANINIYRAIGSGITNLEAVTCTRFQEGVFLAEAGQTYYLQAGGQDPVPGDLHIHLNQLFPPPNDNFADAALITSLPFSATLQINGATTEPDEPSGCSSLQSTAWYKFTPPTTMTVHIDTQQSIHFANVHVYQQTGSTLADLALLGCVFSGGLFEFHAEAGQTYYLQVGGSGTIRFDMRQLSPPANDNFGSAEEVTSFPFSASVDISEAITEPNEPQVCHTMPRTIWYTFTPATTTRIHADTQGSFISGNVNIYHATGPGFAGLEFLGCSGPYGSTAFFAEAGERYYFQAGSAFGENGTMQVNLTEAASILGRIIDAETGAPLPGEGVTSTHITLQRICGADCLEFVNAQYADSEGGFVFDGYQSGAPMPAGDYQIDVFAGGYRATQFGPVPFEGTSLDVGDIPLNRPPGIRGRIVDAVSGNPIQSASLLLRRCDSGSCFEFVTSGATNENGLFHFTSDMIGVPLSDGTYEIEISRDFYETKRIEAVISNGADTNLGDVPLTPVAVIGSISGRLLDAATGQPLSPDFSPSVQLYRCIDGICFGWISSLIPDSQGRFRFDTDQFGNPLPAGTYQVFASADQYQNVQTEMFDVGEGVHATLGDVPVTSFPVRFSEIQPCADLPASGGECAYSVRIWNGLASKFRGDAWSLVTAQLPDAFRSMTDFQVKEPQKIELDKGRSKVVRFRFNVPGSSSSSPAFICSRAFVSQGNNSPFHPVGYRDLFCIFRNATGFAVAASPDPLTQSKADVPAASTGTETEPNNSCQTAQDVGTLSLPFVLDGNLDSAVEPDIDFYRVSGTPGMLIGIDHEGQATGKGTLENPLLGVFDSSCNFVALNDDALSANSRLELTIPADGIFIVGATAYPDFTFTGGGSGSYQLTVTTLPTIGSIAGRITGLFGAPLRGDVEPFAIAYLLRCVEFGCAYVNSQATDSEGRFFFERDNTGTPLRPDTYQVVATANQYITGQTEPFAVGEGEHHEIGDLALMPFPVVFSDAQPCSLPAGGGTCNFAVRITNGLATKLTGKAWSLVNGSELGSFVNFTTFQIATTRDVKLAPGKSTTLRFRFRVPDSVAKGATICGLVYVGQNPSPLFNPLGVNVVFCLIKSDSGFTLLSGQDARAASQQMQLQRIAWPPGHTKQ